MRRGLFAIVLSIIASGLIGATANAASSDWVGNSTSPKVLLSRDTSSSMEGECRGVWQTIDVANDGSYTACVYGESRQIATFFARSQMRLAIREWHQQSYHYIEGVCGNGSACQYSEERDVFMAGGYGSGYSFTTTTIYKDFSKSLVWRATPYGHYQFEPPDEGYVISDTLGSRVHTGRVTLSRSGGWLAAELVGRGIAVYNLETESGRRVMSPVPLYGYGLDPSLELDITDDGRTVVVAGLRGGFHIIQVSDSCGDVVTLPMYNWFESGIQACPSSDAAISSAISNVRYVWRPRFTMNDQRLQVRASRTSGVDQLVTIGKAGDSASVAAGLLALGDSFTSGEGETSDQFYKLGTNNGVDRCHVSDRSYPFIMTIPSVSQYLSVACSGARLHDIAGSGTYRGQGGRQPDEAVQGRSLIDFTPGHARQGEFVARYQPSIVTVGISGNDSGIIDKLKACAMPGECDWVHDDKRYLTAEEIDSLHDRIVWTYRQLAQSSPQSRIYAIGYPRGVALDRQCDAISNVLLTESERVFMNESISRLNQVIARAAQSANVSYIDSEDVFTGHELCQGTEPAMNGLRFGDDYGIGSLKLIGAESFHPTPYGHRLLAARIGEAIRENRVGCQTNCSQTDDYWVAPVERSYDKARQTELVKETCQKKCEVTLPDGILLPGSTVSVSVHSEKRDLGTYAVSDQGGLRVLLEMPDDLGPGFHTFHIGGTVDTGQTIDLYQVIQVARVNEEVIVVGSVASTAGSSVLASVTQANTTPAARITQPAVLGDHQSTGEAFALPTQKTAAVPTREVEGVALWRLVLWGVLGIMAVWLVFVLLLKK